MSRIDYFVGKGSETVGKAKAFSIGFLVGVAVAAGSYFLYRINHGDSKIKPGDIRTEHVSGAEIRHSGYTDTGDSYKFTTTAAGEGEIITTVPKDAIPEARKWRHRVQGVSVIGGYSVRESYSIESMYWRRFDSVSVGAGIEVEMDGSGRADAGLRAGITYWFE